mmetsp:Transcript_40297/g.79596  ORF Transcript_40297/g.79596 Transcript_40297/m.79596 type:complete len:205 (+) Transcript_40297:561-1175(+)
MDRGRTHCHGTLAMCRKHLHGWALYCACWEIAAGYLCADAATAGGGRLLSLHRLLLYCGRLGQRHRPGSHESSVIAPAAGSKAWVEVGVVGLDDFCLTRRSLQGRHNSGHPYHAIGACNSARHFLCSIVVVQHLLGGLSCDRLAATACPGIPRSCHFLLLRSFKGQVGLHGITVVKHCWTRHRCVLRLCLGCCCHPGRDGFTPT